MESKGEDVGTWGNCKMWSLKSLGEIAEVQSGGTPRKSKKEYWDGDIHYIGLIRPNQETISKFLYYLLLSQKLKKQADDCATGAAQKTVSLKSLRNFKVPKFSTKRQEKIVIEMDLLSEHTQRLEAIYKSKLEALKELKQSILHKAFTGQLTIDKKQGKTEAENLKAS
ncbi:restriction endonuclease subunit S [Oscillatoriales cyanobacterium LEGE 11467]|uniref:Restriction endonuclease subunit S n=1 Tax=Zarconia navalis LEGE 11467 TaxID=1828826 RepID=A0A928VZ87_9CYAN|nr:restriction endonuclease subunit S [Zarconia navalis]MBE9040395.1 restriction endonuclease subunit S [Zarconia navalis LEGE 11467]